MTTTQIALPSIMSLFLEMRFNGQPLGIGTGFVLESASGPVLITNRHNVTGRNNQTGKVLLDSGAVPNEVLILHNRAARLGSWVPCVERLLDSGGSPLWCEHPTYGADVDFVALSLTQLDEVQMFPYALSGSPDIAYGPADVVSVVGFPFGLTSGGAVAVWATGFVASEPEMDYDSLPLFLIDCRGRPGQSGSAVIAFRGGGIVNLQDGNSVMYGHAVWKLLGIYSGRINDQSDLGMVWKTKAIVELVASLK